ncbi:2-methoxy-6-polyprenyl-1,4-benzoquinol methylase, mitochondrial [Paraburkholderia domus]|uniref:class I SAM-dependent methyltransferase n=1 Tax=Paraburkholderia domus TaxID=2793075 RepID=UPI001914BBCA|nr:class I SAM-dependent methyltransferase [Paraburkholderia domus]MBK5053043.1 class I SAM-dependent methyltransferase [Burkholderia sp. R-70006]MBK5065363.1 class I SAM-dependent methyltransferase [Burkholderia sp. R-70199]MBK5089731.1 class I SAM-dependent methyltransferase [Burkholderia sp. R-69927]MCI0147728.1 methyltransferase domain-containing protein [Paraburkholderia sediminicola]CAE6728763.1 2-methoxy-6-polyprenyl-1,4-benzoquinol methylase, mitochondrial [Paraburkholderia domus]
MNASPNLASDLVANLDESILLPQLGCPAGEIGVAVGDMLERSNLAVIEASFALLDPHANERILEIGLGNGGHIASVLDQAAGLIFTGIDLSPTMIAEARRRNATFVRDGRVWLETADVMSVPFPAASFDKAITINSTYFWPDLTAGLKETRRVLRASGVLVIAAITPEAANEMPFAKYGFTVHDAKMLELACIAAGFDQVGITRYVEPLLDPPQEFGPREFYLVRACAG